jgi:L-ribulose-5-phosphate 3-epimerase
MISQIGFMQGRLCDQVNGKIQAFPWQAWESEFPVAARIGISAMEWTLDQDRLYENPLMTFEGQERIRMLCQKYQLVIPSLTGDCFMQSPFWKADRESRTRLKSDFLAICRACASVGIRMVVVPLVDQGRLDNTEQEKVLVEFLLSQEHFFAELDIQVIFESDFVPEELLRFIDRLPILRFGINYDIGNSAALGFDPCDEFAAYGSRVMNLHVKDRLLCGTTVPLKRGAAKFEVVFAELAKVNFQGNFILQTARAVNGNHAEVLSSYRDMTQHWIHQFGLSESK